MAMTYTPYRRPCERIAHEYLLSSGWYLDAGGLYLSRDPLLCLLGHCELDAAVELQIGLDEEAEQTNEQGGTE